MKDNCISSPLVKGGVTTCRDGGFFKCRIYLPLQSDDSSFVATNSRGVPSTPIHYRGAQAPSYNSGAELSMAFSHNIPNCFSTEYRDMRYMTIVLSRHSSVVRSKSGASAPLSNRNRPRCLSVVEGEGMGRVQRY
jgi:hypothetical protein